MIRDQIWRRQPGKVIAGLFLVLVILLGMTVFSFSMPTYVSNENTEDVTTWSINYNYLVFPTRSLLYPDHRKPLLPGPVFYRTITDRIMFSVKAEMTDVNFIEEPEKRFRIDATLSTENQWEIPMKMDIDLNVNVSEHGGRHRVIYTADFELPVEAAYKIAEEIMEEIQVTPREGYDLTIKSVFLQPSESADLEFQESAFEGIYQFRITDNMILPTGEFHLEKADHGTVATAEVNRVILMGNPIKVTSLRTLFTSLLVINASLILAWYYNKKKFVTKNGQKPLEMLRIDGKYHGRIIMVSSVDNCSENVLKVQVKTFKDLLAVSDERERPILKIVSNEQNGNYMYSVMDEGLVYQYQPDDISG